MATKKKTKKAKKRGTSGKAKKAVKKAGVSKKAKAPARKVAKGRKILRRSRGRASTAELVEFGQKRGLGAFSAGQAGDLQGISRRLQGDSESAEELLEEGQTFEAEAVAGVEEAADPDVSEVVTHEFPEDDIPEEYRQKD